MSMNISQYVWDPTSSEWIKATATNGAVHVSPKIGPSEQLRSRMMVTLGTTIQTAEWPAGANITYLTFTAVSNAATPAQTAEVDAYAIVTIDAANATEAANILGSSGAPASSLIADSQVIIVPINTTISVPLTAALSSGTYGGGRVDARCSSDVAGDKIDLWIGAN